jgi:hypothetical protein
LRSTIIRARLLRLLHELRFQIHRPDAVDLPGDVVAIGPLNYGDSALNSLLGTIRPCCRLFGFKCTVTVTYDLRVLDFNGQRVFQLFRFEELGSPILQEQRA